MAESHQDAMERYAPSWANPDMKRSYRRLDPVKATVAIAVQHYMVTGKEAPPLLPHSPEIDSIKGTAVNALETVIRVKTSHGVRYFTVRVSEAT